MSSGAESASQEARTASFKAALAGTASRVLALYFSRPIRLFRPSKISGWHSLRGQSLPLLIRQKGWIVIPKHFFPPLVVNALLGMVLWTTYSETTDILDTHAPTLSPTVVAAISGCCAGSVQALAAAPAENVRIVLEGGQFSGSWSVAWKEVFSGTESLRSQSREPARHRDEVRKVREWVREVRGLAGRGWQGLSFGVTKDAFGFSVFFAIFDVSRRAAAGARSISERVLKTMTIRVSPGAKIHTPRVVHSAAIVTGGIIAGLSYEFVCRPFDAARRCINLSSNGGHRISIRTALLNKLREDGVLSFFKDPTRSLASSSSPAAWLRTLGRVGPWGVAFLAWENFSPDAI